MLIKRSAYRTSMTAIMLVGAILTLLSLLHGATQAAGKVRTYPHPEQPETYELHAQQTKAQIIYSQKGVDGKPHLDFNNFAFNVLGKPKLGFVGDEIRTQTTELGTEVTVTISDTSPYDGPIVRYTLLIPKVYNMSADKPTTIAIEGITTTIPGMTPIPVQVSYSVTHLTGTVKANAPKSE